MNNTTRTSSITNYIGIDISKQQLDCWLRPKGQTFQCPNNRTGFEQLHDWLVGQDCNCDNSVICLENTGIYGSRLWKALTQSGWKCAVEKTTVLDKVGPEHHRKDDMFDAKLLAEYAYRYTDRLNIQTPCGQSVALLRQLYGERRRLVTSRTATLTKQKQADQQSHRSELLDNLWKEQLNLLSEQISTLENKMSQVIKAHQGLNTYYELLRSIPGIGRVTATLWLVLFYGRKKLNPKKIASRFGFAPHGYRSGSSVRGKTRSSGHGSTEIRACMALAARSVSTHYERFKSYKERKLEEGKCWGIVRNNLINKLIKIICAIWNSGEVYRPDYVSRFDRQKKAACT